MKSRRQRGERKKIEAREKDNVIGRGEKKQCDRGAGKENVIGARSAGKGERGSEGVKRK